MDILKGIALFFHLVGFASLFGVAAVQVRQKIRIAKNGMLHGALTQLFSGVLLLALNANEVNHTAATVKLIIILAILGILFYWRRNSDRHIPAKPFFAVFALIFVEVIIAVVWMH